MKNYHYICTYTHEGRFSYIESSDNEPLLEFKYRINGYVRVYGWTDVRIFKVEEIV